MLETRTGTTFWRVESKPPQQIQWRPTEKEIFRRPKDDNGYDLATPTVGTVAQKIIARDDPCAAWFFETAGAALDMLNMAGSPIHNLFGDVRVIAVKR